MRANVAIYPVDARGLQAVVPGGSARQGSRGGLGAFTGSGVASQFAQLAAQQETLTSLASDTGGTAFTDTNDFGEAFTQGASATSRRITSSAFRARNANKDGRFRRISVRAQNRAEREGRKRADGYYADRDFTHTAKGRSRGAAAGTAGDADSGDRRAAVRDRRLVPSGGRQILRAGFAWPCRAPPCRRSTDKVTLDVAGFIRDERGVPVGRIRDTLTVPPAERRRLASRSRCCIRPA